MGILADGKWFDKGYDTKSTNGKFVRKESEFRNWVTADGSAGPSGVSGFKAESGRYHLYIANACPWAHRTMIFRSLKGLEDMITVSVVDPLMLENGWELADGADSINGATFLHQIYTKAVEFFSGRVTVPVLWDKHRNTIVNNESAEIIRMFNSAFDGLDGIDNDLDFYPHHLHEEIDALNSRIYSAVNNGVYKSGFASTQGAYEGAVTALFDCLNWLEERLSQHRYLVGEQITEADWRLFTTLIRFDPVYVGHFKCNLRRLVDYPNLWGFTRELYQVPGVAKTINMDHIKRHYYTSHTFVNPTGIVPVGPEIDFTVPHGRGN
ncbi:MAG: glutathione S-transferase family protein [Rhodospirillales bacterium]|jgi:glutathionyl-hydroquinone reductase|nr:glutathione S-transferase family protein [Rhodospirillales bacterium]